MRPFKSARKAPPLGSWLLGRADQSTRQLELRIRIMLSLMMIGLNAIGVVVVAVLVALVVPGPGVLTSRFWFVNFLIFPIFLACAFIIGPIWGTVLSWRSLSWVTRGESPTRRQQIQVLTLPWNMTVMLAVLWIAGTAVYTTAAGIIDPATIPKVIITAGLTGVVICGFGYVFSEFAFRPIAARALETGDPRRVRFAGATGRVVLSWMQGTGAPVAGLLITGIHNLVEPQGSYAELCIEIIVLSSIALVVGFLLTLLGLKANIDPVRGVTQAMTRIEKGDLDASVVVYDGTEIGQLQSGFNRMATGLREREQIRDLFGRHVGKEVAEAALHSNTDLGGEERDVAVLFIDLVGSTQLAASRPPHEVVALLNRFFAVVVAEVERNRGIINKFEGDAALAIFGAPVALGDAATAALTAARTIAARLAVEVTDCSAATGVAYGTVVAGNIGAANRFEYTVIGDPVNEAARLCELAKSQPNHLLASDRAVAAASQVEAARWTLGEAVTLRGRTAATRPATVIASP